MKTIVLEDSGAAGMRQYPGRVRAASRADLSFEVAGKLIELPVKEGQVVEEGELIARLDDRDLSANLKSAQAEADNAAANFARGAKLVKDGFISKTDFDTLTSKRVHTVPSSDRRRRMHRHDLQRTGRRIGNRV